jgi:hypothetical protein
MKKISILISLLLIGAFSSCRKLITDEFPDFASKPTVNAIIRAGEPITVHVSLAGKIDSIRLNGVENAVVRLFIDNILVDNLESVGDGFYESELLGEQEKRYAFEIDIPNFSTLRCETFMPKSEFIRSIEHLDDAGRDPDGMPCNALRITFTNNPNQRQYFQLSIMTYVDERIDYWTGDTIPARIGHSVELFNISDPVLLGEGLPIPVFSNRMIRDTVYTMYLEYVNSSPPLLIELRTIDESYYHYLRSVYLYERNIFRNDIGEIYPPYSLYSNVPGGFGIVGSFSRHTYDIIYLTR